MSLYGKDTGDVELKEWLETVVPELDSFKINEIVNKANQLYYDPNKSIAFIYHIELVKSLAKTSKLGRELTNDEAMEILLKVYNYFSQDGVIALIYEFLEKLPIPKFSEPIKLSLISNLAKALENNSITLSDSIIDDLRETIRTIKFDRIYNSDIDPYDIITDDLMYGRVSLADQTPYELIDELCNELEIIGYEYTESEDGDLDSEEFDNYIVNFLSKHMTPIELSKLIKDMKHIETNLDYRAQNQ